MFGDGSLRVIDVPIPTDTLTAFLWKESLFDAVSVAYLYMRLSWSSSNLLAAGCSNGTAQTNTGFLSVWDLRALLNGGSSPPLLLINVPIHDSVVRSISWLSVEYKTETVETVVTGGGDGRLIFTDLRDPLQAHQAYRVQGFVNSMAVADLHNGFCFADADYKIKMMLLDEVEAIGNCNSNRISRHEACIWVRLFDLY